MELDPENWVVVVIGMVGRESVGVSRGSIE